MRQETADLLLYGSLGLALLSVLHYLLTGVYQLVAGPLHKFKGPWSWIVFPILRHISILKGVENEIVLDLHKKYGPVVRVAPDEVSFTSAAAWQDIYGFGHKQLEKSIYFHARDGLPEHMISAHSSDHSRYRKAVSSAFSEKAIRKQEILISGYVRLFMQRMEALSHGSDQVDMVKWFHLLTFDLIGDLAYGESFGGLKDSVEHSYVSTMFQFVKAGSWLRVFHFYPLLESMALRLTPPKLAQAFHDQWAFTKQVTLRRLNNHDQQGRGDFMDSMVEQHNQPGGLNDMEIVVNSNILLSAGAETSATTLAGVVYFLTRAPSTLAKVQHEVRSAFESQDEINFITSTSKVPFMVACISETMRMYPPVPGTLPRVTNPGGPTIISDAEVPPNVSASGLITEVFELTAWCADRSGYQSLCSLPRSNQFLRSRYVSSGEMAT